VRSVDLFPYSNPTVPRPLHVSLLKGIRLRLSARRKEISPSHQGQRLCAIDVMGTPMDKTKRRMSALFSLSGGDPAQKLVIPHENGQASSDARGRSPISARESRSPLSRLSRSQRRTSSWGSSAISHSEPRKPVARRPTITSIVEPEMNDPLPRPPPIPGAAGPGSRASSPARSAAGSSNRSRPTSPQRRYPPPDPTPVTSGPPVQDDKRKSKGLFGRSKLRKKDQEHGPLAWVIGHEGRLPYNLSLLLNGERVSRSTHRWGNDQPPSVAQAGCANTIFL
jgi:hypothetical protein